MRIISGRRKDDQKDRPGRGRGIEGQWVVVHKGKVVGSSDDGGEMIRLASKYPPEETVVTKILFAEASFY